MDAAAAKINRDIDSFFRWGGIKRGFVPIAWSGSFTFVEMQRLWRD